ncbi:MAG: T9SS type A sorting domain-containing protein [Sphingobacteriales bacterium]|nr:MAG: T9SS type A sorting domain-containing protein [Sphingobacteriales bacterium]
MKKHLLNLLYASLLCCCFIPANAGTASCMLTPVPLGQRVQQATLIVEGKVLAQQGFYDAIRKTIFTSNTIQILKTLKGTVAAPTITIITEGGTVGNQMVLHTSTLQLAPGQTGIFLCIPSDVKAGNIPTFMVYSSQQGFIAYDPVLNEAREPFRKYTSIESSRGEVAQIAGAFWKTKLSDPLIDKAGGKGAILKTTATPIITAFAPAIAPGGIGTLLTITGFNFGASQGTGFVEFPNANDGGLSFVRPPASDYITWTDNQIVVRVPSSVVLPSGCAGTGNFRVTNTDPATGISPTPLIIPYTYTNFESGGVTYRADLINDNGAGGYTFQYSSNFLANTAAVGAFERALDSWCLTQINWNTAAGAAAVNVIASDGVNIVRFDNGTELPVGVLGRLSSYYSGCGPVGGPFNWYVTEMDVAFDDGANWQFGPALPSFSQYDFESVAAHELGHGHQLNHVINTNDVMHYAIANSQVRRTVGPDDITGGNYVTTNSLIPNSCGPTPMIVQPCPLPVRLLSFIGKRLDVGTVELQWQVAEEEDIDGYAIERSEQGSPFTEIGRVTSGTTAINTYSFLDISAPNDVFYRLRILEKDGSISYSATVRVRSFDMANEVTLFPNPAQDRTMLHADGELLEGASLRLINTAGKTVFSRSFSGLSGMQEITLDLSALPAGVYFYELGSNRQQFRGKLVKSR